MNTWSWTKQRAEWGRNDHLWNFSPGVPSGSFRGLNHEQRREPSAQEVRADAFAVRRRRADPRGAAAGGDPSRGEQGERHAGGRFPRGLGPDAADVRAAGGAGRLEGLLVAGAVEAHAREA